MGLHLTKIDAVFKHRIMWCAVAEKLRQLEGSNQFITISDVKREVIDTRFSKIPSPDARCFMCDYAIEAMPSIHGSACKFCPLMELSLGQKLTDCIGTCLNGLYSIVEAEILYGNYTKASKTALEIAFLPVIN